MKICFDGSGIMSKKDDAAVQTRPEKKRKKHPYRTAFDLRPYLLILPMLIFAVLFVYFPFARTLRHAFSKVNALGQAVGTAGLDNFMYLFSRRDFGQTFFNTVRLTLLNVPLTVAITLGLAALCTSRRRFSAVPETLISIPMAVSMSAAALIFKVMLNPTVGFVDQALGIDYAWYENAGTALNAVLALTVWMGIGFNFLLFLGALRGLPSSVLEAARVDGAGPVRRFFAVDLPLIAPTVLYVVCTNAVLAIMTSGPILIITQGGPRHATSTLIYMMVSSGYASSNYSLAACVSLIAFALSVPFALLGLYADVRRRNGI